MRRGLLVLVVLLWCIPSWGGDYSLKSLEIKDDLSLTLKEVDFSGSRYNISLDLFSEETDPSGLYWKLGEIEAVFETKEVSKVRDIPYGPKDRQKLDIYYPTVGSNNRVILFVPGGAWRQGDKSSYEEMATTFAKYYGFTVAVINYTLYDSSSGEPVYPDNIEDVSSAFAWVKKNISRYGGDPNKVFLFGQSAGAHLVSLFATNSKYLPSGYTFSDIAGVVAMSGSYEISDMVKYPNNPLGLDEEEVLMYKKIVFDAFGTYNNESVLDDGSPQEHITSLLPYFLVLFAEDDMPGFAQEALNFVSAIRDVLPNEPERATLHFISRADISEEAWKVGEELASQEEVMSDYPGHYAEVATINQNEYNDRVTSTIAEFINNH